MLGFGFSPILLLLFPSGPSAIFAAVRTIIINTIKTKVARWARPHVAIKRLEGFNPFGANGNASSTVSWKSLVIRIETAFFHSHPDVVFGGSKHAMLGMSLFGHFPGAAFAASSVSAYQQIATNIHDIPAITQARPALNLFRVMLRAIDFAENDESAKALPDQMLSGVRVFCGILRMHREPPVLGVTSRDVDASPAQSIEVTSPFYHEIAVYTNGLWPMQDRALAEIDVDVTATAQAAIQGAK